MRSEIFRCLSPFLLVALAPVFPMSPAFDNSETPFFPPIRSQGAGTNTCQSFSTTYYMYTHMVSRAEGRNQKLDTSTAADSLRFSPKLVYTTLNDGNNTGGDNFTVQNFILKHGAPLLSDWPYDVSASIPLTFRAWPLNSAVYRRALSYRAHRSGDVPYIHLSLLRQNRMKQFLEAGNVGVIYTVGFSAGSWRKTVIKDDPSTPLDDPFVGDSAGAYRYATTGGHYMTVVGYNDALWTDINENGVVDSGEKGAFKIADNYGWARGNQGFMWVPYDAFLDTTRLDTNTIPNFLPLRRTRVAIALNYLVPRVHYTPQLIAQVTVSHPKRDQLGLVFGAGDTGTVTPSITWTPAFPNAKCGSYAFNGTTASGIFATLAYDLTDITADFNVERRYFMRIVNKGTDSARVSGFTISDPLRRDTTLSCKAAPFSVAGGETVMVFIDYRRPGSTLPPSLSCATTAVNLVRNGPAQVIPFRVSDDDTPSESLFVTAYTSNDNPVSPWGAQVSGTGADRLLSITPAYNGSTTGKTTVTVEVYDKYFRRSTFSVVASMGALEVETAAAHAGSLAPDRISALPNPFRSVLEIEYVLERAGATELLVLDLQGRIVDRLSTGIKPAGAHKTQWKPEPGRLASGVYVLRLKASGKERLRRVFLID